jgi:hypothetical protein
MGRRSRKRRDRAAPPRDRAAPPRDPAAPPRRDPAPPPRDEAPRRGYARGATRDAEIRRGLEPLAPGERPAAVTVAAVVAALLAAANVGLMLAGVEVRDQRPSAGGTLLFAAFMLVAAAGMWRAKYWAVLGFQAILGITLVIAGASLLIASDVAAVALCVAILGLGGWLFWKLVRALARLQMPERRPKARDV